MNRRKAIRVMESSYLAAASALLWVALYYLPVGGALFRLALPLPLVLLHLRRGDQASLDGVVVSVFLLIALMGPIRGPLILFPYGILAFWLGWCWRRCFSWWISGLGGIVIGTFGFLIRVIILSLLVGENLWIIVTRASSILLERFINLLSLPLIIDQHYVQLLAILLVIIQELVYIFAIHVLAFWIFPRLKSPIPEPPRLLQPLVALDPL